jgi:hypothetical protein
MIHRPHLTAVVASALVALGVGERLPHSILSDQEQQVAELRRIAGTVLERDGPSWG